MKRTSIVIATIRPWNIEAAERFAREHSQWDARVITKRESLIPSLLERLQPRYVFFPHWSWMIPEEIYTRWECVVFHMTDLPFGRGGSPLQNLLSRGIYKTKITALKVTRGIDEGPVYMKRDLDISEGSAEEIYRRVSEIVFGEMVPKIIQTQPTPIPQEGEGVYFERRRPEQSEMDLSMKIRRLYDHIRMLDAEGYPKAFIKMGRYRMEFTNAGLIDGDTITATVNIKFMEDGDD